jgi:hypothetical protein
MYSKGVCIIYFHPTKTMTLIFVAEAIIFYCRDVDTIFIRSLYSAILIQVFVIYDNVCLTY